VICNIAGFVEFEYGLALGALKFKTVMSCIFKGNLSGKHAGRQSPIMDLKPIILTQDNNQTIL
jgi:hypothetical protein